jgi:hypothetical protein
MRNIFVLVLLFSPATFVKASGGDSLQPQKMEAKFIPGTYWPPAGDPNHFIVFKKNHRFRMIYPAPRSAVYKGKWEVRNDTLYGYLYHKNFTLYGESRKVKDKPLILCFICANGLFYRLFEDDHKTTAVHYTRNRRE